MSFSSSSSQSSNNRKRRRRWGPSVASNDEAPPAAAAAAAPPAAGAPVRIEPIVSLEEAEAALLAQTAAATANKKSRSHTTTTRSTDASYERHSNGRHHGGGRSYEQGRGRPEQTYGNGPKNDSYYGPSTSSSADDKKKQQEQPQEQEQPPPEAPNFGLSGALSNDVQRGCMYKGQRLKFTEPPEARVPMTQWRLYVFRRQKDQQEDEEEERKDAQPLEILHIAKQSAYLFGRDANLCDVTLHHASLSKQHCVLQYRAVPVTTTSSATIQQPQQQLRCKPYLMDLESTNGTFLNGTRLDAARYYELRKGDVVTLGGSSREYVLLTEHTTGL